MIRKIVFAAVCMFLFFGPAVGASLQDLLGAGTGYWIIEEEIDPLMDTI